MDKIISELRSIVSTATTRDDAVWKITDKFPQISATSADKVRKDVSDHILGKINKEKLSLFLTESGL